MGLLAGDSGSIDVADVIGPMTGLDMTKYECVQAFNARGWNLERKASA